MTFGPWARLPLIFLSFIVIALLLLSYPSVAHAQAPQPPFDEKEAQGIDRMIMCPICPAETIDQAQVEISTQMRALVREMLAEGKSRDEILDFFVARYGRDILAAPPKSGAHLIAWVLPIAGVAAALVGVYFVIRAMTGRDKGAIATGPAPDDGLRPYLEIVDRHLALNRTSRQPSGLASDAGAPSAQHPGSTPGDTEEAEKNG